MSARRGQRGDMTAGAVLRVAAKRLRERSAILAAHVAMLEEAAAHGVAAECVALQLDLVCSEQEHLTGLLRELLQVCELAAIEASLHNRVGYTDTTFCARAGSA